MDFIQQVGQRYLEGKANAAPQQLEKFATKQFMGSSSEKSPNSQSLAGEFNTREKTTSARAAKSIANGAADGKDHEIARLKRELARSGRVNNHDIAQNTEGIATKSLSGKAVDGKGVKATRGAFVAEAARPRDNVGKTVRNALDTGGTTIDGKGMALTKDAFIADKPNRKSSTKRSKQHKPEIIDAPPTRRRGQSHGDGSSDYEESIVSRERRRRRDSHGPKGVSGTPGRRSPDQESEIVTIAPSKSRQSYTTPSERNNTVPLRRKKSILSTRGRPPSIAGSELVDAEEHDRVERIRSDQRSQQRGICDARIDMPAPETPSLRILSRREREGELCHERSYGGRGEETQLPARQKSVRRERVGEGSVVDVLEARSVPFRPQRASTEKHGGRSVGSGYNAHENRDRQRGSERMRMRGQERDVAVGIVEVMEERGAGRAPTVRRLETGNRDRVERTPERRGVVEMGRQEGRTLYRVR